MRLSLLLLACSTLVRAADNPGLEIVSVTKIWDDGNLAAIGHAKPPYKSWEFAMTKESIGGPNFIVLPDGRMIVAGVTFAAATARTLAPRLAG